MADWWLIPEAAQEALHDHLFGAVSRITDAMPRHQSENGVTGALGQTLMDSPFNHGDLSVRFDYRKFPEASEEFHSGADGSLIVSIEPPGGPPTEKAVLFQSKLLKGDEPSTRKRLSRHDAERLRRQANAMLNHTDEAIVIFYTTANFYVVDAQMFATDPIASCQHPLGESRRLITFETYVGKWLPRCTRGDTRHDFVRSASTPGAFTRILTMRVSSSRPLLGANLSDLYSPRSPRASDRIR